jgi:hypothetical protein
MAKFVAAVLLSFVALAVAVPVPWKNCGGAGDVISVQSVEASIWPPVHGQKITLAVKAVVGAAIPDGNYQATIKLGPITILDKKGKLSEIAQVKPLLPIPAGPVNQNLTIDVPKEIPGGITVTAHVQLVSTAGPRAICVDVTIPFKASEEEVVALPAPEPVMALVVPEEPAVPVPWKNCGGAGDVISVQQVDASVWPPVHGQKITLAVKAVIGAAIPDATFQATIKLGPITILDRKGKLSDIKEVKLPIPAGPINQNLTIDVPKEIPGGITVTAHVQLVSTAGPRAICVDVTIPFKQDPEIDGASWPMQELPPVGQVMVDQFFAGLTA